MSLQNTFAVTIQLPKSKRIYDSDGSFKFYQTMPHSQQKLWIEDQLKNWAFTEKQYEHTPTCSSKRLHLHGLISFKNTSDIEEFTQDICNKFITPKYNATKLLLMVPIFDNDGWLRYIRKDVSPFQHMLKSEYPQSP